MTITGRALADGQLPNAEGVLYTTPGATTTYIKSITCVNTGAGQNVVELWVRTDGANSRKLCHIPLEANEQLYYDEARTLEATDEIRGAATSANEVDYTISGGEG